jgi:hypothetical protein
VLDILTSRKDIEPVTDSISLNKDSLSKDPSLRDVIFERFLIDERFYVRSLEELLKLKEVIKMDGALFNDFLGRMLSLLDKIIDMQQRFLFKMESTARKPFDQQSWASSFQAWSSKSVVYAEFITTEKEVRKYIGTVLEKRKGIENDGFAASIREFLRLLYFPSQRLLKYSGFLQVCCLLLY